MLDVNLIRQNPEKVREGMARRHRDESSVDEFISLDAQWRGLVDEVNLLKQRQNELSKARKINEARENKEIIKEKESELRKIADARGEALDNIPNIPFGDVPDGENETGNVVVREEGRKPRFDFEPKDYVELGELLGVIDVERAARTSGSRFGYILGDAVLLEFALVKLAFDVLAKENFIPVVPPVMIKPEVYRGMGRLAGEQKEERYYLPKDDLFLTGSAEHTIGPMHMDEVLDARILPRRYVGFSTNFRREAGSYGKDTRGILRVHQFDKVEMFSFSLPEKSEEEHRFLLAMQEKLMRMLDLPYRVVEICAGDMGWTDARQFDIETWMPGQREYRETHSCSNTTDFQAHGIRARYRTPEDGEVRHLHMLNATAFAIGRMLIAILENFQKKDGSVVVPQALQGYVGKKVIRVSHA